MKALVRFLWDWAWLGGVAFGVGQALGGRVLAAVMIIWLSLNWLAVQLLVDFSIRTGRAGKR